MTLEDLAKIPGLSISLSRNEHNLYHMSIEELIKTNPHLFFDEQEIKSIKSSDTAWELSISSEKSFSACVWAGATIESVLAQAKRDNYGRGLA